MKQAVFDTNILIDFSFSKPAAQELIRGCAVRCISVITWMEFLTGIPEERQTQARQFLDDLFETLYPDESLYEQTLKLRRDLRLKLPDAMIYATAQLAGLPLVTRNTKDFDETLPGIYVPYT